MRLIHVSSHGIMDVLRREDYGRGVARYCVCRTTDGRVLEDFRRKPDAQAWAEANKND